MMRKDFLIEADELLHQLNNPNLRLFDVSLEFFRRANDPSAEEIYQQGHIPGAAFFDHQQVSDANSLYMYMVLPAPELATQLGALGISAEAEVVVYSSSILPPATRAWWVLRYAGHNQVRILNGGLAAWKQAGGALEQGVNRYPPAVFTGQPRLAMLASKEEVQAAFSAEDVLTVNTLPLESYTASHIPHSTCLPCDQLMQAMVSFRPDEQLAQQLKGEAQRKRIITYCGGGIAATVNAVAHLMAGNENVAVYDGSMSEWEGEGLPTEGEAGGSWAIWRK